MRITRIKKGTNASANTKKRGILRLLSAPARYIKCKIESAYKKLVKKEPKKAFKAPNTLENEVYNEENLKRKSIDELKEIAKLRRIKNRGKLKKEGLIISNNNNYNNNVNNNNDVNNNTNDDDDTYHGKIRDKISDT